MKWLEIINIQAVDDPHHRVQAQIDKVMGQLATESINEGLADLTFLLNCSVKGNLVIHMYWETNKPEKLGSLLGLSIKQSLKPFGLINHSVWEEYGNIRTTNQQKRKKGGQDD